MQTALISNRLLHQGEGEGDRYFQEQPESHRRVGLTGVMAFTVALVPTAINAGV